MAGTIAPAGGSVLSTAAAPFEPAVKAADATPAPAAAAAGSAPVSVPPAVAAAVQPPAVPPPATVPAPVSTPAPTAVPAAASVAASVPPAASAPPSETVLSGAGAKRGTDEAGLDGDAKRQRVEPPVAAAPPTAVAPTPSSVESAAPAVVAEAAPALMSETATPSIEMAEAGVGADERMATAASASEVDALSLDKDTPLDEAAAVPVDVSAAVDPATKDLPVEPAGTLELSENQPEMEEGFELQEVPDDEMKPEGEATADGDDLMLEEEGEIVAETSDPNLGESTAEQ